MKTVYENPLLLKIAHVYFCIEDRSFVVYEWLFGVRHATRCVLALYMAEQQCKIDEHDR